MGHDRSVIAMICVIAVSTVVLFAGLATSPIYFGNDDIDGDWHLTYARGFDQDGMAVDTETPNSGIVMSIGLRNGVAKGSVAIDGTEVGFQGTSNENMMRFRFDMNGIEIQGIGCIYVPGVLLITVVSYGPDGTEAYSLLFTRDRVLPHMIEDFSQNLDGKWFSGSVRNIGIGVTEICMDVTAQNVSVSQGLISYDGGTERGFKLVASMLQNERMNMGLLVDDDGRVWTISVKKGLIAMYNAIVTTGCLDGTSAYMVRNAGNITVSVPASIGGTEWVAHSVYRADGNGVDAVITMNIHGQKDNILSGEIMMNDRTYEFVGAFVTGSPSDPVSAELCLDMNGTDVCASVYINGDEMLFVTYYGTLPDDVVSVSLRK